MVIAMNFIFYIKNLYQNKSGHILYTSLICLFLLSALALFNIEHYYYNQRSLHTAKYGYLAQSLADLALADERHHYEDALNKRQTEIEKLEEAIKSLETAKKEANDTQTEFLDRLKEAQEAYDDKEQAITELEIHIDNLNMRYEKYSIQFDLFSQQLQETQEDAERQSIMGKLESLQSTLKKIAFEIEETHEQLEKDINHLQTLKEAYEALKIQKEKKEDSRVKLEEQIDARKKAIEDITKETISQPARRYQFNLGEVTLTPKNDQRQCEIRIYENNHLYRFDYQLAPVNSKP